MTNTTFDQMIAGYTNREKGLANIFHGKQMDILASSAPVDLEQLRLNVTRTALHKRVPAKRAYEIWTEVNVWIAGA